MVISIIEDIEKNLSNYPEMSNYACSNGLRINLEVRY